MTVESCPGPIRVTTPIPGVLRTGPDPDQLYLIIAPPGAERLTCHQVELLLPVGAQAEHLVADPRTVTLAQAPKGWLVQHTEGDRFTLRPERPIEVAPGTHLVLALDGVGTGTTAGVAVLEARVTAEVNGKAVTLAPGRFQIQTTDQPLIESFRPDKIEVGNSEHVILTWKGASPKDKFCYWLYIGGDAEKNVTRLTKDDGTGTCQSPPLTATTAFSLRVHKGQQQQFMTCVVTVREPDLTVGKLSAVGTVHLLREPAATIKLGTYQAAQGGTYKAATDGILAAFIMMTDKDGVASLCITTASPDDEDDGHRYYVTSSCNSPANLLVPVPAGFEVTINASSSDGTKLFRAQVTWYPMGTGGLDKHKTS